MIEMSVSPCAAVAGEKVHHFVLCVTHSLYSVLGQRLSNFPLPDVALVAEHSDPAELGRLLQLVRGCAVNCKRKQEYIQIMMTLEESMQHVVMAAIQELLARDTMCRKAELSGDLEQQGE
ncbi:protein Hook homolog 1-like [Hippocampus zosterae]|uniref:protein Hook homolog 1-like n=1 Tax=Hippocampus zosterae TaxID=109293 RepID=UPI00223E8ABF|nr:protein Hook homolog 1-like [Hippocampus zosterae]